MLKTYLRSALFTVAALAMCAPSSTAQSRTPVTPVIQTNVVYPAAAFTATAQTVSAIGTSLTTTALAPSSFGIITAAGTFTTATWAIQCSADNGVVYVPVNTAVISTPGTVALTQTTTAPAQYIVNLAGQTNCRFVTSGTFTATSFSLRLTATGSRGAL